MLPRSRPVRPLPLVPLLLVLAACGGSATSDWELSVVQRGDLVMDIVAVGTLEALDTVEIGSDLTGTLQSVEVVQNQAVTAGQVLARLDPTPFDLAVEQAEASWNAARASQEQAEVTLREATVGHRRAERLLERGASTAVELEQAQASEDQAQAGLAAARAQVAQAHADLLRARDDREHTVISSPIDGVVLQRFVDPGQTVVSSMSATTLFELASDLAAMKADVQVDEADVGRVQAGQAASFTVSAWPGQTFAATVAEVDLAPDPDEEVVVYLAELRLDNSQGRLRPGMTATASVETGRVSDALLVPSAALRFEVAGAPAPTGDHLWIVAEPEPRAVAVTVLGDDGETAAVQAEGLTVGEVVIIGGGAPARAAGARP